MSTNFTLVKRGYNPVEVDDYIRKIEQQLEEYREKSSAINNAIINAQLAADNIIKEAHLKTDKMLSVAETDALNLKQKTLSQLTSIKTNVAAQRKLMEAFQNDYTQLLKKYLSPIEANEVNPMLSRLNEIDKLIDELSSKPAPNIEKTPEEKAVSKITADMPAPNKGFSSASSPASAPILEEKENPANSLASKQANDSYTKSDTASVLNSYAKPDDIPMSNPYAKPNDTPVSNPYAKPNNTPVSNPYAKPNDTPVSNPYAKPNSTPVSNPYAKPSSTPVSNPYAKPNSTITSNPYAGQNKKTEAQSSNSNPPLGGGFGKPQGLNGGIKKPVSPFAKTETPAKDSKGNEANGTPNNVNPFAKPVSPFARSDSSASADSEIKEIDENKNYSTFLASHADDDIYQGSYTSNNSKPGIYRATDLYTSMEKESAISKEEMDELMPSKH